MNIEDKIFILLLDILDKEIEWCGKNPMKEQVTEQFQIGFIGGLEQAKYMIEKVKEKFNES